MDKTKKTILIDLDGVLNTYTGDFNKTFEEIENFKAYWKN